MKKLSAAWWNELWGICWEVLRLNLTPPPKAAIWGCHVLSICLLTSLFPTWNPSSFRNIRGGSCVTFQMLLEFSCHQPQPAEPIMKDDGSYSPTVENLRDADSSITRIPGKVALMCFVHTTWIIICSPMTGTKGNWPLVARHRSTQVEYIMLSRQGLQ